MRPANLQYLRATVTPAWLLPLILVAAITAAPASGDQPEREINLGELVLLTEPPSSPALESINQLRIDAGTLEHGWLDLQQCYRNLNTVLRSEISYQYRAMRDLTIQHYSNIGDARVRGNTVYLDNIEAGAVLCITARIKNLYPTGAGEWTLRNGPFFNRLMDGFFPMHVVMEVRYPEGRLQVTRTSPARQPGFRVEHSDNRIILDSWFEGRLAIEIGFSDTGP